MIKKSVIGLLLVFISNFSIAQMTLPIPAGILPTNGLNLSPISSLIFDYSGGLPVMPELPLVPNGDIHSVIELLPRFTVPSNLLNTAGFPSDIDFLSGPVGALLGANGTPVIDMGMDDFPLLLGLNPVLEFINGTALILDDVGLLPLFGSSVLAIFDGGPLDEDGFPVLGVIFQEAGIPLPLSGLPF